MTYFAFLGIFLVPPLLLFGSIALIDHRANRELPSEFQTWAPWRVILLLVAVAVLYTTPWDNYLVATQVWWYDPALVSGLILGWVPIEEYTFFVLQTVMTGLWVIFLLRRVISAPPTLDRQSLEEANRFRWVASGVLLLIWIISVILLVAGSAGGTYLALELSWALPPIIFQFAFGGDLIWRDRYLILLAIGVPTVYLCIGDALAIGSGTWTIDPAQSTGILVGNLPIEEIIFFIITNTLVVLGMTLLLAKGSHNRAPKSVIQFMNAILHPTSAKP